MSKRVTIVLAALVVALAVFLVFIEPKLSTTEQRKEREGRVYARFQRDDVVEVRIERARRVYKLVRESSGRSTAKKTKDPAKWLLLAPFAKRADKQVVEGVLAALEWMEAERSLPHPQSRDLERFGLKRPRIVVTHRTRDGSKSTLHVGGVDARDAAVYVLVSGAHDVQVVPKDSIESIEQALDKLDQNK